MDISPAFRFFFSREEIVDLQQARSEQELKEKQACIAAEQRSLRLLDSLLNELQRQHLKIYGFIEVIQPPRNRPPLVLPPHALTGISHGVIFSQPRRYRLSVNGGTLLLPDQVYLCILTLGRLPGLDHMIAKKLLLEADEERFLRTANVV